MSATLEAHIRRRILAAGGWLPFDAYMAEALYAPNLGYYSSGRQTFGFGPEGGSDFVTAPEISPLFGQALARQVRQALQLTHTHEVWEFGAGSGALAESVLGTLAAQGQMPECYVIVELSASLRARQQQRLAHFGSRVQWRDSLPQEIQAVVLGNEVLDAMPVKLLHFDGHAWFERGVACAPPGAQGSPFVWQDHLSGRRPPYDHGEWVAGTVTEIHPQAKAWLRTLAACLKRGAVFLFDYGFGDAEYYHPQRVGGTLMCHHLHQADPDPLQLVGEKDITAHVNFTTMALTGQDAGLAVLGYTTQANFLMNCGIGELLEAAPLRERAMAQKLLTEHEMGELFKVIGFGAAGQEFDALGFANGDRSHRL